MASWRKPSPAARNRPREAHGRRLLSAWARNWASFNTAIKYRNQRCSEGISGWQLSPGR